MNRQTPQTFLNDLKTYLHIDLKSKNESVPEILRQFGDVFSGAVGTIISQSDLCKCHDGDMSPDSLRREMKDGKSCFIKTIVLFCLISLYLLYLKDKIKQQQKT